MVIFCHPNEIELHAAHNILALFEGATGLLLNYVK
jgi:hypothetical protein